MSFAEGRVLCVTLDGRAQVEMGRNGKCSEAIVLNSERAPLISNLDASQANCNPCIDYSMNNISHLRLNPDGLSTPFPSLDIAIALLPDSIPTVLQNRIKPQHFSPPPDRLIHLRSIVLHV